MRRVGRSGLRAAGPKIDRIACPWLIRRFVDPLAIFLFVIASEVMSVAKRFNATPLDIEGVFWSHRGETCTFDTMVGEFGLRTRPLLHLAKIVRGADTARPDLVPECAGSLAASLGYSRMYKDDLPQLEAGGDGTLRRVLSLVSRRHRGNAQLAEPETQILKIEGRGPRLSMPGSCTSLLQAIEGG